MVVTDDESGDVTLHEYEDPETGETAENDNEGVRPSDEPSVPSDSGETTGEAGTGDADTEA